MARTVTHHSRSAKTCYLDVSGFGEWGFEGVFLPNIIDALQNAFPSLRDETGCSEWPEKEVRRVAGNGHAIVTVSTYFDLASLCLVPKRHEDSFGRPMHRRNTLAEAWTYSVTEEFKKAIPYPTYYKAMTASNGEAAYKKHSA